MCTDSRGLDRVRTLSPAPTRIVGSLVGEGKAEDAHLVSLGTTCLGKRGVKTQAREAVLEVGDGLVIVPIGLYDHALDCGPTHTPDMTRFTRYGNFALTPLAHPLEFLT